MQKPAPKLPKGLNLSKVRFMSKLSILATYTLNLSNVCVKVVHVFHPFRSFPLDESHSASLLHDIFGSLHASSLAFQSHALPIYGHLPVGESEAPP